MLTTKHFTSNHQQTEVCEWVSIGRLGSLLNSAQGTGIDNNNKKKKNKNKNKSNSNNYSCCCCCCCCCCCMMAVRRQHPSATEACGRLFTTSGRTMTSRSSTTSRSLIGFLSRLEDRLGIESEAVWEEVN